MNGSLWRLPLRTTRPSRIWRRSPGPATTRLMKLTSAFLGVAFRHTCRSGGGAPHMSSCSAPVGGWKTTTSPTSGSENRAPMRLTSTRWPISSVGTIDSLGILYGLIRNAWMPSASPSATATMRTSSSSEPEADEPRSNSGGLVVAAVGGSRSLRHRIVQQACLDDLLGLARVAALADAGALADAAAQVVELGAPDVA